MFGGDDVVHLTVSGHAGSGTTTLVKHLCEKKGWTYLNGGSVFRAVSEERGVSLEEFSELCDSEPEIDKSLDDRLVAAMKDESGPEVIESRLSGWWAYREKLECVRLWLSVSAEERANRVVKREGGNHSDALERIVSRTESDQTRYNNLYGISLEKKTPYNLIIKSDTLTSSEVLDLVEEALTKKGVE
jgi:cytidylate kinase